MSYTIPILSALGGFCFGAIFAMVMCRKRMQALQRTCDYDALTGLRKSHGFEQQVFRRLRKSIPREKGERCVSGHQKIGVIAFLDVDGFKSANDQFGHETGDEVLRLLTRTTMSTLRHDDIAVRRSNAGDEFILFLSGATPASAEQVLGELRESFERALVWALPELQGRVSFSFGTAKVLSTYKISCITRAVALAERNMYEDKKKRRMER